jgi:hypothetical protein
VLASCQATATKKISTLGLLLLQLPVCHINSLLGLTYYPLDQTYPPAAAAFSLVVVLLLPLA